MSGSWPTPIRAVVKRCQDDFPDLLPNLERKLVIRHIQSLEPWRSGLPSITRIATRILLFVVIAQLPPDSSGSDFDREAEAVLRKFAAFVSEADTVRVRLSMNLHWESKNKVFSFDYKYTLSLRRPRHVSLVLRAGMSGCTIIGNGTTVYTHTKPGREYTLADAPEHLDTLGAWDTIGKAWGDFRTLLFVDILMSNDPYRVVKANYSKGRFLGKKTVDKEQCYHLELVSRDGDRMDEIWVSAGRAPRLLKIVSNVKPADRAGETDTAGQERRRKAITATIRYERWEFGVELNDAVFLVKPPSDFVEVDIPERPSGVEAVETKEKRAREKPKDP